MLVARRYRRAIPFRRMDFPRQRRKTILLAGHRRTNVSLPKNDRTTETRVTTERTNRMAVYSQASYTHRVRTRCVDGCQLLFTILDSIAKGQRSNASCISQRERIYRTRFIETNGLRLRFESDGPWPSTKTRVARISYVSFASLQTRRVVAFQLHVGPKYHIIFIANNAQQWSRYERTYL